MKIFESGALDMLKDMEKGPLSVSLADIAPDTSENSITNDIAYDSSEDDENDRDIPVPLTESTLRESADDLLKEFLSEGDGSYEAFKNSDYYSMIGKNPWTLQQYKDGINRIRRSDPDFEMPDNIPVGRQLGNAYKTNGRDLVDDSESSVYSRDDWEPTDKSELLANWEASYSAESISTSSGELYDEMEQIVKDICLGRADKRHALIAGDPGIGKTYTIRKTVEETGTNGRKYCYECGDVGGSLTSVVPFFYFHSKNEVVILDDNDKMLMKDCNQSVQNFMKGVLDPSALTKPVSVRASMLGQFQKIYDDYLGELEESHDKIIDIDTKALREGNFRVSVNGECVLDELISMKEAQELSNMIRPLKESEKRALRRNKLYEAIIDEDLEDDEDPMADDISGKDATFPRTFLFNSSFIFVSNLPLKAISPAVLDRCESVEIALTLKQFMAKLNEVLGGLCAQKEYSSTPSYLRDWSKQSVYTILEGIVEAFYQKATLFGVTINVKRKFTFRMFEEFVGHWTRKARAIAEKEGLNLQNEADRRKIEPTLVRLALKQKIIPWISKAAS